MPRRRRPRGPGGNGPNPGGNRQDSGGNRQNSSGNRPQGGGQGSSRNANNGNSRYSAEPPAIVLTHHEAMGGGDGNRRGKRSGPGKPSQAKKNGRPGVRSGQPQGTPNSRRSRSRRPKRRGPNPDAVQTNPPQQSGAPAPSARRPAEAREGEPQAFDLFCAYHLGLTESGTYKAQNINEIARRFNLPAGRIKQFLQDYGIDSETVINADFDMALAQLDMMVAPPGIDRRELAKTLYEDFLEAPKKARDWQRELAEDAEANRRTFGK